jgi:hypothetical protein
LAMPLDRKNVSKDVPDNRILSYLWDAIALSRRKFYLL